MKTSGTITWSGGGTGGEFFYEQSDTIGSAAGGVSLVPDNSTLELNGNVLSVKDYVSKSYIDAMLGDIEASLASI